MIEINLVSAKDLDEKHWYLPLLIVFGLILIVSWLIVQIYFNSIKQDISNINAESSQIEEDIVKLKPSVLRYKEVRGQLENIRQKILSIEKITVSKLYRYMPIILLEHLQLLKPEGVWFTSLTDQSDLGQIKIEGGAFDNLLVAEFMHLLGDTEKTPFDYLDIRSQVGFSEVFLEKVATPGAKMTERSGSAVKSKVKKAFDATKDIKNVKDAKSNKGAVDQRFPELSDFPRFYLTLKYREREE